MKKAVIFSFIPVLIMLIASMAGGCNKKATSYNPDFEGTWRATIVIDSANNTLRYNEITMKGKDGLFKFYCSSICEDSPCNCTAEESGRAVVSTDEKSLRIGSNGTVLSIDQEPYEINGEWKMKLQNITYIKQ